MTKINFEESFEIYLFTCDHECVSTSKLNEFLAFLKFFKAASPYKFSFVAESANLIPEMSLNENILIDFSPNSLTESKEVQFQDFLKAQKNGFLEKLYQKIELPSQYPSEASAQMKKISNLIKSILSEGQFIFLEEPESGLGTETLSLFIETLKEHVANHRTNVFVYSKNPSMWMAHCHKIVERKKDFSFHVSAISRNFEWQSKRADFYNPPVTEPQGLKFHVPTRKKSTGEAA
jgi:ABC-type lipoprotein export system ATPase subunit